jgi:ATP-dependent exoDNAse (exonuclease V) alpha subunit
MLLPNYINKIKKSTFGDKFTNRHISFTNAKRIEINRQMMNQVVKQKKKRPLTLPKLGYDKNSQTVDLLPGMPIIARINAKEFDICNNELFNIKKNNAETLTINDEDREIEIPINKFQKLFYVAYCITVCKSQGSTFDFNYTIHEFEKFDNRLKYVACSRSTDIKHINIV